MMTAALAWLRAHPRLGVLALCAACFLGGWFAHRPPAQTEHEKASDKETSATKADVQQKVDEGPKDLDWTFYGPGAGAETPTLPSLPAGAPRAPARPGAPAAAIPVETVGGPVGCTILATLHEHDGPTVIQTHETTQAQSSETTHLDLTLAPAEQSRAISLGMKVHPNLQLVIGGGFKLPDLPILGSFWVMGEISPDTAHPLQSDVTLSLAKQF